MSSLEPGSLRGQEAPTVEDERTSSKEMQDEENRKKLKIEGGTLVVREDADCNGEPPTPTEIPPERLVFGIELLHSMILEAMDDSDLLHIARLVNMHWHSVATKILQTRYQGSIRFDFDKKRSFWCRDILMEEEEGFNSDGRNTLVALTTLMCNSLTEHFPVTDFTFIVGSLDSLDLQQFLNMHGSCVRQLELRGYDKFQENDSVSKYLRKLLTLPNLIRLRLDLDDWLELRRGAFLLENVELFTNDNSDKSIELVTLPKLKQIQTWSSQKLLELIQASPTLTQVSLTNLTLPIIEYLIDSSRLSLLKDFMFNCDAGEEEAFEKLADAKLKIERIAVNLNPHHLNDQNLETLSRISQCLENILEASSESLESVTWFTSANLPSFSIPVLKNVKTLTFTDRSWLLSDSDLFSCNEPKFPPGTSELSLIFPSVTQVVFKYQRHFKTSYIKGVSIYSQPLLTVKTLTVSRIDSFSAEMIAELAWLFPNVSKAEFSGISNFPQSSKSIWKFLNLAELLLEVKTFSYYNLYPGLDMGFTGLTSGAVKKLEVMSESEKNEKLNRNLLRKNPSIADLTDLTLLKIRLINKKQVKFENDGTAFITELSVDYAFRLLPKLMVYIGIRTKGRNNYDQMVESLGEIVDYGRGQIILEGRR